MARGADGSLLTSKQLKELNRQRFIQAVDAGNLYNTGPITDTGGTEFGTDRWASYFKSNPDEAPSDWTGDSKSYVEKPKTDQEFLAEMDNMEVYDEDDNLIYADGQEVGPQDRGLTGNRDGDGSLRPETKTSMRPVDIKDGEITIKDEQVPTEEVMADIESRRTPEALAAAEDRAEDRAKRLKKLDMTDIDAEVEAEMAIEEEDSIDTWAANFDSMSDDMFNSIKPEDIAELSANAQAAFNQKKGMTQGLDEEVGGMLSQKPVDEESKNDMMKSAMINAGLDESQSADLLGKLKGLCN